MKFRRKKKGSTLLIVVCFFSILAVIILSLMGMVTTGFKIRKDTNKRIEGFYGADSGIEIAKNTILQEIDKYVELSYKHISDIEASKQDIECGGIDFTNDKWREEHFKIYFEKLIDEKLEKEIDNAEYTSTIYDEFERAGKIVKVNAIKGNRIDGVQSWTLESNFKDNENKEREVVVNYNIITPEYGKKFGEAVTNASIFNYVMGIDGNLDINNNGAFEALGDMWIGGKYQTGNRNQDGLRYKPAIKLYSESNAGSTFLWRGDIVTPKDLMISDTNMEAYNIYADDFIYRGNGNINNSNNILKISNDLYVYNDFIFDGTRTSITMQNYYGLDEFDETEHPSENELSRDISTWETASSIIVNSSDFGKVDKSKINILKDMYVFGTAYLKLDGVDYKTGESVVINKFTEPYTNRRMINQGVNESEYLYNYINPLHIVDKKWDEDEYKDLTITDKVNIIEEYFEQNPNKLKESVFNGILVGGDAYTAGVTYNTSHKGIVKPMSEYPDCEIEEHEHISHEDISIVECKQKEFAEQVYNMGNKLSDTEAEIDFDAKESVIDVEKSFNWKFIRENLMTRDILQDRETGEEIFKRSDFYPKAGSAKDTVLFKSTKTVKEILGDKFDDLNSILGDYNLNILFHVSERDENGEKVGENKNLVFSEAVNNFKVDGEDILIPSELIGSNKVVTIIISDSDIIIDSKKIGLNKEIKSLFYTSESLDIDVHDSMIIGNKDVPDFNSLNGIFKELFVGIIDGVVGGGIIDQGNNEDIINSSDILEEVKWNLTK